MRKIARALGALNVAFGVVLILPFLFMLLLAATSFGVIGWRVLPLPLLLLLGAELVAVGVHVRKSERWIALVVGAGNLILIVLASYFVFMFFVASLG